MVQFDEKYATVFQSSPCYKNPSSMSLDDPGLRSCWFFERYENSCFSGKDGFEYKRLKRNSEFDSIIKIFEE
jgi:hypothetical protein